MRKLTLLSCICATALSFISCNKNSETIYEAIVTIKPDNSEQACFFQLDPKTALIPTNEGFQTNPFKKEVRAHCLYSDLGAVKNPPVGSNLEWRSVTLKSSVDTILTKKTIPDSLAFGTAPIELMNSWMTCFEDGYLTLYFEGLWGDTYAVHTINLVETADSLTYILNHDDNGDSAVFRRRGLIAFDLRNLSFDPGKEYDLTLKYTGYVAAKTVKFHYKDGVWARPTHADVEGHFE